MGKPVWVRFTLVPGLTDDPANVEGIARFVAPMKNVEWVEVQPFHQLGAFKWKAMNLDYKHADTPPPTPDLDQPRARAVPRCGLPRALTASQISLKPERAAMIDLARDIIGTQPILAVFLAIGVGYLVGQINLGGFSLGVGAVLFVGLAIGAFAPKAQIIGPIGLTGLIMFLYGIGILYGRQFFEGMTGAAGTQIQSAGARRLSSPGLLVALGLGQAFGIKIGHTLGIYAGSMTSTATLQAALDVMQQQRSVDRLFDRLSVRRDRPDPVHLFHDAPREAEIPAQGAAIPHGRDHARRPSCAGRTLEELGKDLPDGVQVTMVRKGRQNVVPAGRHRPGRRRRPDDRRRTQGRDRRGGGDSSGKLEPGRIVKDRSALDYIRVFVGKASMVGIPLAQLPMPAGFPTHLLHVRRYDMDIVPTPDLTLEFGDRVGVLMPPDRKEEIRKHFGDTVKATAEFSYVSLGLGMVLGVLLGLIPIPIPGVGTVTLGIGGGPLIVALILGKLRRTGPMLWVMPLPANIVLRNFGLAMFLAAVGINAGQPFVRTVAETGLHDAVHRRGGAADDGDHRAAGRLLPA